MEKYLNSYISLSKWKTNFKTNACASLVYFKVCNEIKVYKNEAEI